MKFNQTRMVAIIEEMKAVIAPSGPAMAQAGALEAPVTKAELLHIIGKLSGGLGSIAQDLELLEKK